MMPRPLGGDFALTFESFDHEADPQDGLSFGASADLGLASPQPCLSDCSAPLTPLSHYSAVVNHLRASQLIFQGVPSLPKSTSEPLLDELEQQAYLDHADQDAHTSDRENFSRWKQPGSSDTSPQEHIFDGDHASHSSAGSSISTTVELQLQCGPNPFQNDQSQAVIRFLSQLDRALKYTTASRPDPRSNSIVASEIAEMRSQISSNVLDPAVLDLAYKQYQMCRALPDFYQLQKSALPLDHHCKLPYTSAAAENSLNSRLADPQDCSLSNPSGASSECVSFASTPPGLHNSEQVEPLKEYSLAKTPSQQGPREPLASPERAVSLAESSLLQLSASTASLSPQPVRGRTACDSAQVRGSAVQLFNGEVPFERRSIDEQSARGAQTFSHLASRGPSQRTADPLLQSRRVMPLVQSNELVKSTRGCMFAQRASSQR